MVHRRLFLIALLLGILCESLGKKGFVLLAPKLFTVGSVERLSLNLLDISSDGTINVRLLEKENDTILAETEIHTTTWNGSGIYLTIPFQQYPSSLARLQVVGTFKEADNYSINATKEVGLQSKRISILISTDKSLYNPAQIVKFRVLVVTSELKLPAESLVGEIEITDPNNVHVALWNNVSFAKGIVTEKLQLPDEPEKGVWYIKISIGHIFRKIAFEVTEYVLPKFGIAITLPPYLLTTDKNITWKICAMYTYGMPVEGQVKLDVHYRSYYFDLVPLQTQVIKEIQGCYLFTVNIPSASPKGQWESDYTYFQLTAEVTEQGTGVKISKKSSISTSSSPLIFGHLENELLHFKHGLPLKRALSIKKPDGTNAAGESVELCMTITKEHWSVNQWISNKKRACKNYTSSDEGWIYFTLPAQSYDTTSIVVKAKSNRKEFQKISDAYRPVSYIYFWPWYSPSGSHLLIEPVIGKLKCGEENTIKVKYTVDQPNRETIFFFQLVSVNGIVDEGFIPHIFEVQEDQSNYTDDTYLPTSDEMFCSKFQQNVKKDFPSYVGEFTLHLTPKLATSVLRLLVYYIKENGETVGDSRTFHTSTPCFENQVTLHFEPENQKPGSSISQFLKGSPFSVCSIDAVDKSVILLGNENRLTLEQIIAELQEFDVGRYYLSQESNEKEYCSESSEFGSGDYGAAFTDSIEAFENARLLVMTDFTIEHRPCFPNSEEWGQCINSGGYGVLRSGNGDRSIERGPISEDSKFSQIRSYFPETWLWELHNLDETGELILKRQLPDTITEWISGAVCISHDTGLGIAKQTSLKTFKPFFVSINLPYSIIRGEAAPVTVTVFNYRKDCLPVDISLEETTDFALLNESGKVSVCVCGGKSVTHKFVINPKTLGEINITATGRSGASEGVCGNFNSESISIADAVTKQLLVKPEGYESEEIFNSFFCTKDYKERTFNTSYSLNLPEDIVEGSARAYISVSGDLMGPMLSGLQNLVQLPSGCGEQNMVHFVPNIMILEYLNATGKPELLLKRKALHNIQKGYLQQLTFKRHDGSYSTFGKLDVEGSLWLSAFVYRSFSQAMKYIYIDGASMNGTLLWILDKQQDNGCFYSVGTVHHKALKGGVAINDQTPATLTAYVLISLMAAENPDLTSVAKGLQCLEATASPSNYSLSLFCYAAALAQHPSANSYLLLLEQTATWEGDAKYWKSRSHEIDVETAAYVVLALLKMGGSENLQRASPIVRWITKQRNQNGGFVSTQDTVLALQALTQYAIYISEEPQRLIVHVTNNNQRIENFYITKDDSLMQKTKKVPTVPSDIKIQTSGSGCAVVQAVLRYNIHTPPQSRGFQLSVEATRGTSSFYNRACLKACISYSPLETSNMVVIEIEMASGFEPDTDSLEALLQNDLFVRRYENNNGRVNIYISEMRNETKCLPFVAVQVYEVENMKPATAKVYDYYDREHSIITSYAVVDSTSSDC